MTAEAIAKKARKSIWKFCSEECGAYCCRKGYLTMTERELSLFAGKRKAELLEKGALKQIPDGKYSFFLGSKEIECPHLKDLKCLIHAKHRRPNACKDFPIFIDKKSKTVKFSTRCPAVKANLFYPLVHQLKKLGWKVEESGFLSDSDFYTIKTD